MARLMTTAILPALACGLALAACQPASPNKAAGADGSHAALPGADRKPGLWEQKVSNGTTSQLTRLCLDAAAHARMGYLGASLNDGCRSHTMTPVADGSWTFTTVCKSGDIEVTTRGSATGDFTSHYQVKLESTAPGQAPQRFVVDAAWKGDCPKDMAPGDIVGPDGQKRHLAEVRAGSPS
jgi:hypothetical protein